MQTGERSGIEYSERPAKGEAQANIVILHGYGADMNDLAPLADYIDPEGRYRFIFPNAPLQPRELMMTGGRAWFPIDGEAMMQTMMTGQALDFREIDPEGLHEVVDDLSDFFAGFANAPLILGGFSQGSMVALSACLQLDLKVKALLLLSSALTQNIVERAEAGDLNLDGLPVFQSHGDEDSLLPAHQAEELADLLEQGGANVQFENFVGGHEIPVSIIEEINLFLKRVMQ